MQIIHLSPAKMDGGKGERTFEIKFPDGRQITCCWRLRGELVGNHFHSGSDPSKKPEYTILLSGIIDCDFHEAGIKPKKEVISAVGGPVLIVIEPLIGHTMRCLTDCIFAEYRITHFNPADPDCHPLSALLGATTKPA